MLRDEPVWPCQSERGAVYRQERAVGRDLCREGDAEQAEAGDQTSPAWQL